MANKTKISIVIIVIILIAAGSTGKGKKDVNPVLFNSETKRYAENENYIFYFDMTSTEASLLFENKKTGNVGQLIRNPLKESIILNPILFAKGKYIYYIYLTRDYSIRGMYYAFNKFQIIQIDTTNFDEKRIFEVNADIGDNFLGIKKADTVSFDFFTSLSGFFLDDTYFYFVNSDAIYSVHRRSGVKKRLIESKMMQYYAYDGSNIFYTDDYMHMMKYNTETKECEEMPDIITEKFILTDTKLLFLNRTDKNKIYSYDLQNRDFEKINDKGVWWFKGDDEYIFYQEQYADNLTRLDIKNRDSRVAYDKTIIDMYLFASYDKALLFTEGLKDMIKLNKKTLEIYNLTE